MLLHASLMLRRPHSSTRSTQGLLSCARPHACCSMPAATQGGPAALRRRPLGRVRLPACVQRQRALGGESSRSGTLARWVRCVRVRVAPACRPPLPSLSAARPPRCVADGRPDALHCAPRALPCRHVSKWWTAQGCSCSCLATRSAAAWRWSTTPSTGVMKWAHARARPPAPAPAAGAPHEAPALARPPTRMCACTSCQQLARWPSARLHRCGGRC